MMRVDLKHPSRFRSMTVQGLFQPLLSAHVRTQSFRHSNGTIFILAIFQNRHQRTTHRQAGTVQRVQQFRLTGFRVTETCLHATGLEVQTVADRRNFTVLLLSRNPLPPRIHKDSSSPCDLYYIYLLFRIDSLLQVCHSHPSIWRL